MKRDVWVKNETIHIFFRKMLLESNLTWVSFMVHYISWTGIKKLFLSIVFHYYLFMKICIVFGLQFIHEFYRNSAVMNTNILSTSRFLPSHLTYWAKGAWAFLEYMNFSRYYFELFFLPPLKRCWYDLQ